MPQKIKEPQIIDIPAQKMAVVQAKGDPNKVFPEVMPALYGSVYSLRAELKNKGAAVFKVTGLRARYPDAHLVPKDKWTMSIALPVPEDTTSLPQKVPAVPVRLETWKYGKVAQVLHVGTYQQEDENIKRLRQFIEENGYEINGDHEEEYLTRPEAKEPKTIIRYPVKKKS